MKKSFKILLADLAYMHPSEYIHPIPLNIGYMAAYVKQEVPAVQTVLLKSPESLYREIDRGADYDVVALSNYDWNVNLDRQFLRLIKRRVPRVVTVMGGPNVNDESEKWMRGFFASMPDLDFYIVNEGEYKFARLVRRLMECGGIDAGVWEHLPPSIMGFDRKTSQVIRGTAPDVEKCDCAGLPSPYLTGLLDPFLADPHLVPIIETNRGCPYSCAFCCWGKAINSKIRQFSLETVVREIEYISARTKNPIRSLYIADANFGIFHRDVEIAGILKDHSVRNEFPKNIYMYFAKNTDEKVLKVAEILKGIADISMSKQSLNKEVLAIIRRSNISDDRYDTAYAKLQQLGASSYCELIYGLPGETLESFLDGFEKVARRGLRPVLYPLILIRGSEIDSEAFREKYRIRTAFRIIPRYTGSYQEVHSVEYEEVVVEHRHFSKDDFFQVRLIQFLYWIFSEKIFAEFVKWIRENDGDIVSFIRFVLAERRDWPASLENLVDGFERDARAEMLDRDELKFEFMREEIDRIRARGLALNISHFCRLITSEDTRAQFRSYLTKTARRYLTRREARVDGDEIDCVVSASFDKIPVFPDPQMEVSVNYEYDVEAWINDRSPQCRLANYRTAVAVECSLRFEESLLDLFHRKYHELQDVELALYYFRMDFISAPYRAYTYSRFRSDDRQVIPPADDRLMRDIPQAVRTF